MSTRHEYEIIEREKLDALTCCRFCLLPLAYNCGEVYCDGDRLCVSSDITIIFGDYHSSTLG
jgi:hypothetical protein